MITINIMGGLGNQLFQIYTLLSTAIDKKQIFYFENITKSTREDRPFYWDSFLSRLSFFIRDNIRINNVFREPHFNHIDITKLPYDKNTNIKFIGYFQSYKYFHQNKLLISKMIQIQESRQTLRKTPFVKSIDFENTVSLHFRIGDYANLQQHHPVMSIHYYINAIKQLIKDTNRDDWNILYFYEKQDEDEVNAKVKAIGNLFKNLTFISVDHNIKDWQQMLCMSLCSHNIIANSTFSWWGAYLNDNNNFVYYPNIWFGKAQGNKNVSDLFLPSWKRILDLEMNNLYCLHYLLPGNRLLNNPAFRKYYDSIQGERHITDSNHLLIKIEDSIHYKILSKEFNFDVYELYVRMTKQNEHNTMNYKNLIKDFNISKMSSIEIHNIYHNGVRYNVIKDGLHRISILKFNNIELDYEKHIKMI